MSEHTKTHRRILETFTEIQGDEKVIHTFWEERSYGKKPVMTRTARRMPSDTRIKQLVDTAMREVGITDEE